MKLSAIPTCWFLLILAAIPCSADWMAGTARIKITPETPLVLSGYAGRTDPSTSIKHDLWAKALVLEDESGKRVAIITTDLAGIYADMATGIYAGIEQKTGIKESDVLLTWSHTHSGPRLSMKDKPYPGVSEEDTANTVRYTQALQAQLIELVESASQNLQAADLSWGTGFVPFVMNRRQRTPEGVRLNPNPSGHVDRSMPCMKVTAADGGLLAGLFQVACHNTTLTGKNHAVCGDYAGFAQVHIEEQYPNSNAMFMTGCAGNANPYPRGTMEIAEEHGRTVAREVCRLLGEDLAPIHGPLVTASGKARLTLQASKSIEELEEIVAHGPSWLTGNARKMADAIKAGESLPTHFAAPVSVWQFGEDLTLVGLSGEVVSGYVLSIQNSIGHRKLWIGSYCHDYYGYLPSAQIVRDGGYETRGLSNGLGWFDEQAEADMVESVTRLAKRANRVFE